MLGKVPARPVSHITDLCVQRGADGPALLAYLASVVQRRSEEDDPDFEVAAAPPSRAVGSKNDHRRMMMRKIQTLSQTPLLHPGSVRTCQT